MAGERLEEGGGVTEATPTAPLRAAKATTPTAAAAPLFDEDSTSWPSQLLFHCVSRLVSEGGRRRLETSDLWHAQSLDMDDVRRDCGK